MEVEDQHSRKIHSTEGSVAILNVLSRYSGYDDQESIFQVSNRAKVIREEDRTIGNKRQIPLSYIINGKTSVSRAKRTKGRVEGSMEKYEEPAHVQTCLSFWERKRAIEGA